MATHTDEDREAQMGEVVKGSITGGFLEEVKLELQDESGSAEEGVKGHCRLKQQPRGESGFSSVLAVRS